MKTLLVFPFVLCAACVHTSPSATNPPGQWSSTRTSSYDWTCKTANNTVISGHNRQDAAFQACANLVLQDGVSRTVSGGTYRIEATPATAVIPPEPPEPTEDAITLSWSASEEWLEPHVFWPFKPPQMIPSGTPVTYEVFRWKYLDSVPATKVFSGVDVLTTTATTEGLNGLYCWCVVAVVNGVTGLQSDDKCFEFGS